MRRGFWRRARGFPNRLHRWGAPLPKQPDRSVHSQLAAYRLAADDIRWIVLSHLHGDHVAGLRDFPAARLIVAREAFDGALSRRGVAAVMKAYLPGLLPADFEFQGAVPPRLRRPAAGGVGTGYRPVRRWRGAAVSPAGPARGQIGMLAETARGPILCVADSVFHRDLYLRRAPARPALQTYRR